MIDIDILIYDFDGVIADTAADIAGGVQATQRQYGAPVMDIPTIISHVGFGAKYLLSRCLPDLPPERAEEALSWYKAFYQEHSRVKTELYPTVRETLERIYAAGVPQFVVSNKPEPITLKLVEELGVAGCFTKVLGPESLEHMKPNPEGLVKCMDIAGRRKGLMVGDSFTDIQAGRSAGIHTCGALYGIGDRVRLKAENADFYVEKLGEIFEYVRVQGDS